jgi:hypothetical protein
MVMVVCRTPGVQRMSDNNNSPPPFATTPEFGRLLAERVGPKPPKVSQSALARWLVKRLPDDRNLDATAVRGWRECWRRIHLDELELTIERLELDRGKVYRALRIWPPDLTLEGYERYRTKAAANGNRRTGRRGGQQRPSHACNTISAGQPHRIAVRALNTVIPDALAA